jgi:hypothetical protein
MVERSKFLPSSAAVVGCLLAYGFAAIYRHASAGLDPETPSSETADPDALVREPLIPHPEPEPSPGRGGQDVSSSPLGPLHRWRHDCSRLLSSDESKNLSLVVALFFLMAVSKAIRPLFTSYIQHRDGATTEQVMTGIPSDPFYATPCFHSVMDL